MMKKHVLPFFTPPTIETLALQNSAITWNVGVSELRTKKQSNFMIDVCLKLFFFAVDFWK